MSARRRRIGAILVALLAASGAARAEVEIADPGDVLRGLDIDVRAGDRLDAWFDAHGRATAITDIVDAWQLELDHAPDGSLPVRLQRGATTIERRLPGARWSWSLVAPACAAPCSDARLAAGAMLARINALARERDWPGAARACAEAAVGSHAGAVLERCLVAFEANPDRAASVVVARQLVALRASTAATAQARARAELALARSAFNVRDYPTATRAADTALRLAEGAARANATSAGALQTLGFIDYRQGMLDRAMQRYGTAEAMLAAIAPDSAQYATLQGSIAALRGSRGDLDAAVAMAAEAIVRMQRVAPRQLALGRLQFNAGLMSFERGRLGDAERFLGDAMATFASASPDGAELAMSRAQLAQTLERRGELVRAETLLRAAVDRGEAIDPQAYETLSMRLQLAIVLFSARRVDAARVETATVITATDGARADTLHADALALHAELDLDGDDAAHALADADAAIALLRPRDRRIQLAGVLIARGEALRRLGRLDEAAGAIAEGLAARVRLAPHTELEAQARFALARVQRDQGFAPAARATYAEALDALEAQRDLLGGNEESRARWTARAAPIYREYLDVLLDEGDIDAAWLLLDRYRAREFLATLGRRREVLVEGLPVALREEARAIAEDYLRAQKAAQAGDADAAQRFAPLRRRRAELDHKLAVADPRLAGIGMPSVADARSVAAALPADAALVSYAVLADRSIAFVLRPGDEHPRAVTLDAAAESLARDIDALRLLLTVPDAGDRSREALDHRSRALHARLVAPFAADIADARRLYVLPDGALHRLPFTALLESTAPPRYLGERHALTHLTSAGAFLAQVRSEPPRAVEIAVLAVPDALGSDTALPAARAEAEMIAALFAPRARLSLGHDVTSARALAALAEADVVHFASHAVVDPGDPLASYLRMGDAADARLGMLDVMRAGNVRADLVTLSACDSALGLNAGGEGLVGLTRAFQVAGVRSVVASLWRVADLPTGRLMAAFYAELARGVPRDLALASAQRQLIASAPPAWQRLLGLGEDLSHPNYWSAFVLAGAPQ